MPPSPNAVLVYITHEYSSAEKASLLDQLNRPNRQFTLPLGLPDLLVNYDEEEVVGKSIDEIVDLHKAWVERNGIDPNTHIGGPMFVLVDEDASSSSPHRVQMVHLADGAMKYETIRAGITQAVGVITAIHGGQQDWDDFTYMARPHGGVLPAPEREEGERAGSGAGGKSEAGTTPVSRKKLPHKERPTEA